MDAGDVMCKNCGTAVQKLNRNWSRFAKISVIILIIAAFGTYIVLYNRNMIGLDFLEDLFGSTPTVEDPPAVDTPYVGQPSEYEQPQNDEVPPARRSEEEQAAVLSAIMDAVNAYMREHSHINFIISSMGYLHNISSGDYITLELLGRLGHLDDEFLAEDVLILYLRPKDVERFDEVSFEGVPATQMEPLTVFLAYEVPTGIGLHSRLGTQLIFRENLNQLLISYYTNNGEISRPTRADRIYHYVVEMIQGTNPVTDVFIRYLAVDDVHGFVAFSTDAANHIVTNYIFVQEHENNASVSLRVLASGFEVTPHPIVAINGAAPNFNFQLLPNYDITRISLLDKSAAAFEDILEVMVYSGQLEEDEEPEFMSVTPVYAYIVDARGNVFLGHYNNGWEIMPVGSWQVAEDVLQLMLSNPPLYIIWQQ